MNELPEGWLAVKLTGVCELNPAKPKSNQVSSDLPVTFVPMAAVDADSGTIANPSIREYSAVAKGFTSFQENDVIMAKITPCMENGKAAIARGLSNKIGFGSTEFHVFRPSAAVLPEYVFRFIRQESFRKSAEANMTGSVGQKRVPASFLNECDIPLPPLAEQRRIVAKLETLLGKVDACQQRLAKIPLILKRFRQAVLAAVCSGKLTADWRGKNSDESSAIEILKRVSAEALLPGQWPNEEIPSGWVWVQFGDVIAELRNGVPIRPNQEPPGIPILRISAARSGKVDLSDIRFFPEGEEFLPQYKLQDRDLLFTRYNGSLELLGVCGMVRGLGKQIILYPDKLMRVRFGSEMILPEYAEIFFSANSVHERIISKSKSSAGQNGVSGSDIKAQPFALPSLAEQREIVRRVEAFFKLADQLEARYQKAKAQVDKLQQSILAKAFRGELVPTEAELARQAGREYESAAALLARLREGKTAITSPKNSRRHPKSK